MNTADSTLSATVATRQMLWGFWLVAYLMVGTSSLYLLISAWWRMPEGPLWWADGVLLGAVAMAAGVQTLSIRYAIRNARREENGRHERYDLPALLLLDSALTDFRALAYFAALLVMSVSNSYLVWLLS